MVDREVSRFLYDRDLSHGDRQTVTHSTAACSNILNEQDFELFFRAILLFFNNLLFSCEALKTQKKLNAPFPITNAYFAITHGYLVIRLPY